MADNPIRDWHRIAVELLMTDADLALQSVASLFATDDKDAVARVVHNTREVYDSILVKRKEVALSTAESTLLEGKLDASGRG